jgi:hypothetical protein
MPKMSTPVQLLKAFDHSARLFLNVVQNRVTLRTAGSSIKRIERKKEREKIEEHCISRHRKLVFWSSGSPSWYQRLESVRI